MSETAPPRTDTLDLTYIDDPNVRRVLRSVHQQLLATLNQQQVELDALLEVLLEKHVTSMGEFKRLLVRLQQDKTRTGRIHEAIASTAQAPAGQTPPSGSAGAKPL
jgi:hypothetical protein